MPPPPRKKSGGSLGLILGILAGVLLLVCGGGGFGIYYLVSRGGEAFERAQSSNNMKQMGLACHNSHDVNGVYPNNTYAPDGKPLLSWRVHILPYVEQDNLYRQFKLDEPWDGPNNIRLLNQMPRIYATPAEVKSGTIGTKTYYRGFSSSGAVFARRDTPPPPKVKGKGGFEPPLGGFGPQSKGLTINNFTDGMSNTILIVEAGTSVEWTKPDDLDASPGKPFPAMGGVRPNADTFIAVMADGSFRPIKKTASETQLRAAVTYAGGEVVYLD
jgi:hypothetical protein